MANDLITRMADHGGLSPEDFWKTLFATIMPSNGATREHAIAFLQVADQYNLNPFTREIFAFPGKSGGVQPVVSIDGWIKMANSHPLFDGMTHRDNLDGGQLVSVTCEVYRLDRTHPITATEYMAECKRNTEPWNKWPRRMLRHKATIQAIRYAFGFSGLVDPDEAERWHDATADVSDSTARRGSTAALRDRLCVTDAEAEPANDGEAQS